MLVVDRNGLHRSRRRRVDMAGVVRTISVAAAVGAMVMHMLLLLMLLLLLLLLHLLVLKVLLVMQSGLLVDLDPVGLGTSILEPYLAREAKEGPWSESIC
jgi:hypothetical protein